MQRAPIALDRAPAALHNSSQLRIERIRKADMANEPLLEEGKGAHALCAVDDLVGHDKVHGPDGLLQRADGAEGDDAAHADVAQGGDVCAGGDLVRGELVVLAVAREEGDGDAVVLEDLQGRGRVAPGRERVDGGDGGVAFDLREACAAYHGDVDRAWEGGRRLVGYLVGGGLVGCLAGVGGLEILTVILVWEVLCTHLERMSKYGNG